MLAVRKKLAGLHACEMYEIPGKWADVKGWGLNLSGLQAGHVCLSTNAETGYLTASRPFSWFSGGCYSEKSKTTDWKWNRTAQTKPGLCLPEALMAIGSGNQKQGWKKSLVQIYVFMQSSEPFVCD